MTSGEKTESESDSFPGAGTEERVGFCATRTLRQRCATKIGVASTRGIGVAERSTRMNDHRNRNRALALEGGLAEWTESLRVTSWWDGGGTERVVDMAETVESPVDVRRRVQRQREGGGRESQVRRRPHHLRE